MNSLTHPAWRRTTLLVAMLAVAVAAAGAIGATAGPTAKKAKVAYLSFAVANTYDAPMLAAAKKVARAQKASVTVFDAANDPKKQLSQLQTVIASKQYNGIIVQPIFGPQLIRSIRQAIKAKIKVVNIDQILGLNPSTHRRSRACPATSSSSRRTSARSRAASSSQPARSSRPTPARSATCTRSRCPRWTRPSARGSTP